MCTVDDVLNVDVPYGIDDDDDDDNVDVHDDDACHLILLDTAGLEILELIISNGGCEVLNIQILLAIGFCID